jgi:LysM repeat protein
VEIGSFPPACRALIAIAAGATLTGVIEPTANGPTRVVRRRTLVPVFAAAVVLAACESGEGGQTSSSTRSTSPASSTTVASTTTTTPPPATYQVKRGDTLTAIARFFHVSTDVLALTNQLADGDQITEGQVLQIPPSPPVQLAIMPANASAGTVFELNLTGAIAGEVVTFEIASPDGGTFTGSPHSASPEGVVTATYRSAGDTPGTYSVVATGDRGTSVQASFVVEPA